MTRFVYTDGFKTYDGLVNFGYKKHYRVKHGDNEFADGRSHMNGIENFWAIAKGRLSKFRGISKGTFALHLKECEFRFNHRQDDLYKLLLKILRKNPIYGVLSSLEPKNIVKIKTTTPIICIS